MLWKCFGAHRAPHAPFRSSATIRVKVFAIDVRACARVRRGSVFVDRRNAAPIQRKLPFWSFALSLFVCFQICCASVEMFAL